MRDNQRAHSGSPKSWQVARKRLGNPKLSAARRSAAAVRKQRVDQHCANITEFTRVVGVKHDVGRLAVAELHYSVGAPHFKKFVFV
jgi:hypothetical protein